MRSSRFFPFILIFLFSLQSYASHIRAGEVIATQISGLTYQFTFLGYRDVEGVLFGQGEFDFGDGNIYRDDPNPMSLFPGLLTL